MWSRPIDRHHANNIALLVSEGFECTSDGDGFLSHLLVRLPHVLASLCQCQRKRGKGITTAREERQCLPYSIFSAFSTTFASAGPAAAATGAARGRAMGCKRKDSDEAQTESSTARAYIAEENTGSKAGLILALLVAMHEQICAREKHAEKIADRTKTDPRWNSSLVSHREKAAASCRLYNQLSESAGTPFHRESQKRELTRMEICLREREINENRKKLTRKRVISNRSTELRHNRKRIDHFPSCLKI